VVSGQQKPEAGGAEPLVSQWTMVNRGIAASAEDVSIEYILRDKDSQVLAVKVSKKQ
jgi:hypothetical protein